MRNADLPPPVTSPCFFNLANNEVQMPSLQPSTQNDESMIINIPGTGSSYPMESNIYNDAYQLRDGALANIPYQPLFGSLHDYQSSSCNFNTTLYERSTVLGTKPVLPQFQLDLQNNNNVANARKRSIDEVNENLAWPEDEASDLVGNLAGKKMKRKKVPSVKGKQPCPVQELVADDMKERKLLAPVRRSQKLSDKITALQKLVSPYGKTDTASVLQEASLYIRLLQEQIQNLFQMLSRTYNSFGPLHSERAGMKPGDLRSRGLCLVPISVIQKVAKEEQISIN